ncbi:MAG: ABC transporter permease [Bacillota bacterium]
MDVLSFFLAASMRMSIPLLIAALGLIISERAGMMNIGGEGIMLTGAFCAYAVTKITGNYWLGLLFAMLMGMVTILIYAYSSITLHVRQVVTGAGLNMFCSGITSFLYRRIFRGATALSQGVTVESFPTISLTGLSDIPYLGPLLFKHNIFIYFGLVMVFVLWFILFKTSLGLKIIAVGENPKATESFGVRVVWLRYGATLFSGLMLGIAGAYLSIAQSNSFGEGMTAGRGFIAMAVVILGKWNPVGALLGALLFGAASSLQMTIQNLGLDISNNLIMTIPYICTVLAVIAVCRNKIVAPSALGIPYRKS